MIIDIIVILLIIFSAYTGYKKGILGILISFIALILSIFLGFMFKESLANFLYESTPIGRGVENTVISVWQNEFTKNDKNTNIKFLTDMILDNSKQEEYVINQVPKTITMFILKVISFVIILLVVYIICRLFQMLANLFTGLPVIGNLNKLGGAGINVLQTLVKIWIVLLIIYFIIPIQKTSTLSDLLNNTTITKTLYENNIFVSIMKSNV